MYPELPASDTNERDEGSSTINYEHPTKAPLGLSRVTACQRPLHPLHPLAAPPIFHEQPLSVGVVPFGFTFEQVRVFDMWGDEFSFCVNKFFARYKRGGFTVLVVVRGNFSQSNTRHIFTLRFAYQVCHIIANL